MAVWAGSPDGKNGKDAPIYAVNSIQRGVWPERMSKPMTAVF